MLTMAPLDTAGAISDRYSGATTVRPPEPSPPQMRAKSIKPRIPEEKTCMNVPVAQSRMKTCHDRSRPILSVRTRARREPNAAPRTPNEDILAFRSAMPLGLSFQSSGSSLKSCLKESKPTEALNPPSS